MESLFVLVGIVGVEGDNVLVGEEEVGVGRAEPVDAVGGVGGCQGCPELALFELEIFLDALVHGRHGGGSFVSCF